jgi:hypothetical protein
VDISRRLFIRNGVATVTVGLTAPSFLTAIAQAQGGGTRNLGRRLSGRRQRCAEHAHLVPGRLLLQPPSDDRHSRGPGAAGRHRCERKALGLHPRLGGLLNIYNEGRLALVQRTGYQNSSRSHFEAGDIYGTANPQSTTGSGWLGRYLDTLPRPLDALTAWNTTAETPRALLSGISGVPCDSEFEHVHIREPEPWRCRAAGARGCTGPWHRTPRAAGRISRS